jgi:hypothetical protein
VIVPNYVPDPLEVPGNVADERYPVRVEFIRRVTMLHFAGTALVCALSSLPWPRVGTWAILGSLAAVLVALDVWRIRHRGRSLEARVSSAMLPLPIALTSWLVHEGLNQSWPIASPIAGLACAAIYTMLCREDYSFVGSAALALIASTVILAGFAVRLGWSVGQSAVAMSANACYLFYFEYDLASLLSRRRRGEELAAIVDLYRDVFNFFGYALRVLRHWRKHRIWA